MKGLSLVGLCVSIALAGFLSATTFPQKTNQSLPKKTAFPLVTGIQPDVVVTEQALATIRLRGTRLKQLPSVEITDCEGKQSELPVANPKAATFTVTIPASLLLKPCVLHISNFALGVADPQLAHLKPPPYSSANEELDWGGTFNEVLAPGGIKIPEGGEVTHIRIDTAGNELVFVLGKRDIPLFRINPLTKPYPSGLRGATECDLFLPGVSVTDVQWGGDDEEFWIGTLSSDGNEVEDRRLLSSMVNEPSSPRDVQ